MAQRTGEVTDAMTAAIVACNQGDGLMQSIGPMLRDRLAIEGLATYYGGRMVLTGAGKKIAEREKKRDAANQKRARTRIKARAEAPTAGAIRTLRAEAGQAGDVEMVRVCDRALEGSDAAIRRVGAVIAEARGRR